jgi:hypothetical protein
VLAVIQKSEGLNVFINESATATKDRVVNFSIFCNFGSFCMKQDTIFIGVFGAEKQANWLKAQIEELEVRYKAEFE